MADWNAATPAQRQAALDYAARECEKLCPGVTSQRNWTTATPAERFEALRLFRAIEVDERN